MFSGTATPFEGNPNAPVIKAIEAIFLSMKIPFSLPTENAKELANLKKKRHLSFVILEKPLVNIHEFHQEFNNLCRIENQLIIKTEQLVIKKYKLALLKAFEAHLKKMALPNSVEPQKKKTSAVKYWGSRIVFSVLLFTGLTMDGIASFLGVQQILSLVSVFSSAFSLALGIIFCLINTALFYSFEAGLLKKALGIESVNTTTQHYDLDDEEIEATKHINKMMMAHPRSSFSSAFATIVTSFNKNIIAKNANFQEPPSEKGYHLAFRHAITAIGAIMQISSGYFLAASLLAFVAPALIGTPIGWAIVGFGMLTYLAFFLAMRGQAVSHMFNPAKEKFDMITTKLDSFEAKSEQDFTNNFKKNFNYRITKEKLAEHFKPKKKANLLKTPTIVTASYTKWQSSDSHQRWEAGAQSWEKVDTGWITTTLRQ
jgi:hypothetical protein